MPVTNPAVSLARNRTAAATSSGAPMRFIGVLAIICSRIAGTASGGSVPSRTAMRRISVRDIGSSPNQPTRQLTRVIGFCDLRVTVILRRSGVRPSTAVAYAALINAGQKVAILVGQGALGARGEVTQLAMKLNAPVAKALLGKAVLPDDSPYTTGGIGHLGTEPSDFIMHACDTLLILGSTMPWVDSYPKPGQARAIQVDLKPEHIGIRYPVEVPLVSDVKATVAALLSLLQPKEDGFLKDAQNRMRDWRALLDRVCATARTPLRPQMVMRELSNQLAPDAVISLDCGANTHFAARIIELREQQKLTGTGMLATMAPGLPFAIAAQLAFPNRQSVAVVGDGGFTQLMGELVTAVKYQLPIKIIILKNNSLAEVLFEQKELGNPTYGCELAPIDFVAFAKACGADGFRCAHPAEVTAAMRAALHSPRTSVLEVLVDPDEKPAMPSELKA